MSSVPMLRRPLSAHRRRGVAMITTVMAASAAASIVLVLVHLSLSDLRAAAAQEETASARAEAQAAISDVATALSIEPSSWADRVHPRERARVCVAQRLAPVYQPGSSWPPECGTVWSYTDPTEPAAARVEIHPPSLQHPQLVVTAVGKSGGTLAARVATFTQPSTSSWTMLSAADLDVDQVQRWGSARTVRGASVYSGGDLALPSQDVIHERSVFVAEGDLSRVWEPTEGSPLLSNRLYARTLGLSISDVRDLVPAPLRIGQLRTAAEVDRSTACRGSTGRVIDVDGKDRLSQMCLSRSARLQDVSGASMSVPADTEAYLVITGAVAGEPRVRVYTSGSVPAPATSGDLRANAASQVSSGTHPGVAGAGMWRPLGEFDPPANGVIAADRDIYLGACGTGFLTSGPCDTQAGSDSPGMAVTVPLTVFAGSDSSPRDIYLGSPIHNRGGQLGAVAFGKVQVPYWARPAGEDLTLDVSIAALGADDGEPGLRQYPLTISSEGMNRGGAVVVTGSVADSELNLAAMSQFDHSLIQPASGPAPSFFPPTRRVWSVSADRPETLTAVCGSGSCEDWLGGGSGGGGGSGTPPSVPGPVTVTAGNASATVSWPLASDVEVYRVFWSRVSGGAEYSTEVEASSCSSTCSADLTGLLNGARYRAQVDATGPTGATSARSSAVEFVPDGIPSAPTDLVGVATGPNAILLEWNRATTGPQPTGFRVYRDGVLLAQTAQEFWADDTITPGSTVTYQVRAINDAGESALSDPFTVTAIAGRPTSLSLTGGQNQMSLSWATSPGTVTGYRVYRSTSATWPGSGGLVATITAPTTTWVNTGLADGTRYWYWVTAYNTSGESPPVRANAPTLPGAITDLTAVPVEEVGGRIAAAWTALSGQEVTGYRIYRIGVLIWTGTATSVNLDGIDPAVSAAYTVRAYNDSGEGPLSNAPTARPVPNTPTGVTISTSGTSYSGSFSSSAGADNYTVQLERRGLPGSEVLHGTVVQTATTFSSASGIRSVQYRVRVRATNPSGNSAYSAWSAWTAYTTPADPTIDTGVVCGNGYQYCVTWTQPVGTDSYLVDRSINNVQSWVTMGGANNGPNGYLDNTAPTSIPALGSKALPWGWRGFENNYRVRACNTNGCSDYSNVRYVFADLPALNGQPSFYQEHRVYGCSGACVPWRVGIPNGWSPGVTVNLTWGTGTVMIATHGSAPGAYSDQVVTFIRAILRVPRYGCYALLGSTDDGSYFIWETSHFGGTYAPLWGFTGWMLWNTLSVSGHTYITTSCAWLPPADYNWVIRADEQTGNAALGVAWQMSGGPSPFGWLNISNTWINRDPVVP